MSKIELTLEQKQGYAHKPGKQIRIFPFVSNPGADRLSEDLKSFQGVVGEVFRSHHQKGLLKDLEASETFHERLKQTILNAALAQVETDVPHDLRRILTDLFFTEKDNLVKFHTETLCYLNFVSAEGALKNLGKFMSDVFFSSSSLENSFSEEEDNLLNKLMLDSLPPLPNISKSKDIPHINLLPQLIEQFNADFDLLKNSKELFLKHIEDLSKFYFFQYFSQVLINFKSFGQKQISITPISFSLEWEILSNSRLNSHTISWKNNLSNYCLSTFVHANVLELLNHIYVDDIQIKDYHNIKNVYNCLDQAGKDEMENAIKQVCKIYTNSITNFYPGSSWENCMEKLAIDLELQTFDNKCGKLIYELWYKVKYQFDNSDRHAADIRYVSWFFKFCQNNFLKHRGRLGNTLTMNQEILLFLTRLCVGNNDKIRLKLLWHEFEKRGVHFDETSKSEIVKLYEKINLIEKKSDSGDAQYVKAII
ncbi:MULTISPECIES: DNA phosphorothioation-dependent restriction protein DptG [Sphingobacterium]|uniref:DNA phosphorothioation-dependent restriction protein DptG n=1 Tax=Sphingobacterium TaxID=28453 RepID=UPI00257F5AD9|nr:MULTISPECIES: DNA phosphorothioation-dependent restriction protein DptG [Sphingobacterium]